MQLDTSGSLTTLSVGGVIGGGGGAGRGEEGGGGEGVVKVGLKGYVIFSKTIARCSSSLQSVHVVPLSPA